MTKESKYEELIKPFVVLIGICLVVAALLGVTNMITSPIIEENARITAENTRAAVMEGAEGFEEVECDTEALGIVSAYKETSGRGYVITASNKGYGGEVVVTVGISMNGKVIGISADVSTETKGVGSKAGEEMYTDLYLGASGSADVDTLSGATYSSTAIKTGVNSALAAFEAIKEVQ